MSIAQARACFVTNAHHSATQTSSSALLTVSTQWAGLAKYLGQQGGMQLGGGLQCVHACTHTHKPQARAASKPAPKRVATRLRSPRGRVAARPMAHSWPSAIAPHAALRMTSAAKRAASAFEAGSYSSMRSGEMRLAAWG